MQEEFTHLIQGCVLMNDIEDEWVWIREKGKDYSMKSAHKRMRRKIMERKK